MPALRFDTRQAFHRFRDAGATDTLADVLVTLTRNAFTTFEPAPAFDIPRSRKDLLEAGLSPSLTDALITTIQEARGDIPDAGAREGTRSAPPR